MITLENESGHDSVFDDWNVRIDGVRLMRTPVFSAALNFCASVRNDINALEDAVFEKTAELCDDINHSVSVHDTIRALQATSEITRLLKAAEQERQRLIDRKTVNFA